MRRRVLLMCLVACAVPARALAQPVPQGADFLVNSYTLNQQTSPEVAADGAGDFIVAWESFGEDGDAGGIFARRFGGGGGPLGPQFQVNTFTPSGQVSPAVAADGAGNFVIAWESWAQDGSDWGVRARMFDASGSPAGGEFQVNTYTTGNQRRPSVAMDASGGFVVVWHSYLQDGSTYGVFGQRFDAGGSPLGPEFRVNTRLASFQGEPAVAVNGAGEFVVVWSSNAQDGSGSGIFGQRFDSAGAPLGIEFQVNAYTSNNQFKPSLAAAPAGEFVVVWKGYGQGAGSFGLFGRRFDAAGSPEGGEFQVTWMTTQDLTTSRVSMDSYGAFVVVWARSVLGSGIETIGRHYDPVGSPQGGEFLLNSASTGTQERPGVAKSASGDFMVAFQSYPRDGSLDGVVARRFAPPPCVPLPAEVSGLQLSAVNGGADLHFTWTDQPDADDYIVFEDTDPSGVFTAVSGSAPSGVPGLDVSMPVGNRYFLIGGRNICGVGPKRPPPDPNTPV